MNINKLKASKADAGVKMTVKDLSGEEMSGVTITLLGQDSAKYREIQRRRQQAAIERVMRGKKPSSSAEKLDDQMLDDAVEMTVAWEGIEDDNGAIAFSPEKAREIYKSLPYVREQISEFFAERQNFV